MRTQKLINIKTHPKSFKTQIIEHDPTHFEIWIREAPDKGKANQAVIKTVAQHLEIAPSTIFIKKGLASRNKIVQISGTH